MKAKSRVMRSPKRKLSPIATVATIILILTAAASALVIAYTGRQDYMMMSLQRDFKQSAKAAARDAEGVDLSKLIEQNADCAGWIQVDNTNVSFPLIQATEEKPASWWLWKNFFGEYSERGCIVVDEHTSMSSMEVLISGHRLLYGTDMFSDLSYNHEQGAFDKIGMMHLTTLDGITRDFTPICAYMRDDRWPEAQRESFSTFDEMRSWLLEMRDGADAKKSGDEVDAAIASARQVIVTYCCSSPYASNSGRRTYTIWSSSIAPSDALNEMNGVDWKAIPDRVIDL